MLILTRKKYQSVIIAGNIEIKIISIGRNKVKIAVSAPRQIPVNRKELLVPLEYSNDEEPDAVVLSK